MTKFDQKIAEISKQVLVQEVDTSTFTGFLGSLAQGVKGGIPLSTASYSPANLYVLMGGKNSLNTLRNKLKVINIQAPTNPKAFKPFGVNGEINNEDALKIAIYNAYDAASRINAKTPSFTIDDLVSGKIEGKSEREKKFGGNAPAINKQAAHKTLMEEITKLGISNLVKYMTPQQYEQAEKGGLLKQAGNALNTGIMNTAKSAINYASNNQVTTL